MKQERAGAVLLLVFLLVTAIYGCKEGGKTGPSAYMPEAAAVSAAPAAASKPAPPPEPMPEGESDLRQMAFADAAAGWLGGDGEDGSFLWITSDGGKSWARQMFRDMYINAVNPAGAQKGWVIGSSDCRDQEGIRSCTRLGIYGTADGGAQWSAKWEAEGIAADPYGDGQIRFADESLGLAVMNGFMLRTRDGGEIWQPVSFHNPDEAFAPYRLALLDGSKAWVLGSTAAECAQPGADLGKTGQSCRTPAVARTEDGGSSWQLEPLPGALPGMIGIGISFPEATIGRLLLYNPDNLQATLYTTDNGGNSWSKGTEIRGGRPYARDIQFIAPDTGFIPLIAGAGPIEGGLLVTRDGGSSWNPADLPGMVNVGQIAFPDRRNGWLLGRSSFNPREGAALFRTGNGGEAWERVPLTKPVKEGTAFFTASAWKMAVKSETAELWVKDARNGGVFSGGVKIILPSGQRAFPWVAETGGSHPPQLAAADVDKDGRNETAVILTTGYGTGILQQELHVLRSDLSEVPADNPVRTVQQAVQSAVAVKDGKAAVSMSLGGESYSFVYEEKDAGDWFDEVAFGAWTTYQAENGTIGFRVSAAVSPGTFLGDVTGELEYRDGRLTPGPLRFERMAL